MSPNLFPPESFIKSVLRSPPGHMLPPLATINHALTLVFSSLQPHRRRASPNTMSKSQTTEKTSQTLKHRAPKLSYHNDDPPRSSSNANLFPKVGEARLKKPLPPKVKAGDHRLKKTS
ncbi:hypothetical protein Rs2_33665 [Raphanus sativus]|nr:hypothetical protein Rs2_33665 [Raphanus sativus]